MPEIITLPFEISRRSMDYLDDGIRYFYSINFSDGRPNRGVVDLMINRVRAYRDNFAVYESSTLHFHELVEAGLEETDYVAFLKTFFPHGEYKSASEVSDYTKKGVGSTVLEELIKDSVEHGAKMMYVFTNSESMQKFLAEKHGFIPFDRKDVPIQAVARWYKML